jgi:hypothetical protein
MRWLPALACMVLLAGCGRTDQAVSPAPAPAATVAAAPAGVAGTDTMARYDGYGEMRFGMDEATFDKASSNKVGSNKAWGGELKGAPEQDSTCFYKTPKSVKSPRDIAFMFEAGHFVRYDVGTAKEAAPGGGKVGMDEAQILALYGARVEVQPHFYVDGANYLRVAASQGNGVLLFETDEHGKVTRWRAGVPPQVDYVEGCS